MHHFQLYYQRADAKITSFWYGCARVASSPSAGISKIKIVLSISSIRSMFRSLLGLVYLSWSRNVMHVSCLHSLSIEAAIAIEWLFILSANDYSITLCYSAYAQWSNIVCTIHKYLVNEAGILFYETSCVSAACLLIYCRLAEPMNVTDRRVTK